MQWSDVMDMLYSMTRFCMIVSYISLSTINCCFRFENEDLGMSRVHSCCVHGVITTDSRITFSCPAPFLKSVHQSAIVRCLSLKALKEKLEMILPITYKERILLKVKISNRFFIFDVELFSLRKKCLESL